MARACLSHRGWLYLALVVEKRFNMPPYAFFEGKFIPLSEAKIGVMTHAFNYGTACFEGIRGHWNGDEGEVYLFRAQDHYLRLEQSCRVLNIDLPYATPELCRLTVELVQRSGYREDVYIRPIAYKSSQSFGVRLHDLEDDLLIIVAPFAPYLNIEEGIRCCVSSWRRVADDMIPPRAKITGLYVNSALAKTEAVENGFDEAILLTPDGHVSEGSGENIFLVLDGKLVTPSCYDNILMGITRDTVIELAKNEMGIETVERRIDRSELYIADECFLTGTAAYVTPIVEVDHRKVGSGEKGAITKELQRLYLDVVYGRNKKYHHWCTPIYAKIRS
jgi:branched-chain amino acid aminotransferase